MKVSLRVLTALTEKRAPDPVDVVALRQYLGATAPHDLDELACEVIQSALGARAQARAALKGGGVS